nr:MAG TPA: hypothetical protein [Caudoviricetes sp.]
MAHELVALRGFSALTQKHGGKSDRSRCGLCGGAFTLQQRAEYKGGAESTRTGEKLRGNPDISGTGIWAIAGAERPTHCIKCRAALRGARTRLI